MKFQSVVNYFQVMFLVFLCLSCSKEKKLSTSEASLEGAVKHAAEVLKSGDAKAIEGLFFDLPNPEGIDKKGFPRILADSNPRVNITFHSCQVSGNMGIALVSFSDPHSQFPFFARWENEQWKFYLDFLVWQKPKDTKRLELTESDMKDALILQKWVVKQPFAGASGMNGHKRLAWYLPKVPSDLKIELFYETPSPSMDHDYMWKIKIEETEDFKKFTEQFLKPPANAYGECDLDEVSVFNDHPDWWKAIKFDKYKIYRHRVKVVNSQEIGYLVAFFDKDTGHLYIQAF